MGQNLHTNYNTDKKYDFNAADCSFRITPRSQGIFMLQQGHYKINIGQFCAKLYKN
jgi:hypothetical protein